MLILVVVGAAMAVVVVPELVALPGIALQAQRVQVHWMEHHEVQVAPLLVEAAWTILNKVRTMERPLRVVEAD